MALFTVKKKKSLLDNMIDDCLCRGSGFVDGKKRIKALYKSNIQPTDRANHIKKEYGIGGWGRPLDGDGLHGAYYDAKGIKIEYRENGQSKEYMLNWHDVEIRIGELINENLY